MSKTLNTIQTIVKIAKVLAIIVMVASIIGAAGSAIALGAMAITGGESELTENAIFMGEPADLYFTYISTIITCVAEAILAYLAMKYFNNELAAGTPFTFDGSKQLLRLGLINLAVAFGVAFLEVLIYIIMSVYFPELQEIDSNSWSLGTGIAMMLLSLVFKYGAETASPAFDPYDEEKERIIF